MSASNMAGLWTSLAAAMLAPLLWLFGMRRRAWHPSEMRLGKWHGCAASSYCEELVRPLEIMCPKHWALVPVPIRMALRGKRKTYASWSKLAQKAIDWRARG